MEFHGIAHFRIYQREVEISGDLTALQVWLLFMALEITYLFYL